MGVVLATQPVIIRLDAQQGAELCIGDISHVASFTTVLREGMPTNPGEGTGDSRRRARLAIQMVLGNGGLLTRSVSASLMPPRFALLGPESESP